MASALLDEDAGVVGAFAFAVEVVVVAGEVELELGEGVVGDFVAGPNEDAGDVFVAEELEAVGQHNAILVGILENGVSVILAQPSAAELLPIVLPVHLHKPTHLK